MSAREWKAGDVALVAGDVAIRVSHRGAQPDCAFVDALGRYWRHEDDTARPLVVIDPEDREQVDAICKALVEKMYRAGDERSAANGVHPATMAAALRSLLTPPRPDEPTGKYAVVKADGVMWCRAAWASDRPWSRIGTTDFCNWSEMDVESVEFEGMPA